jgi:hypothetical protein
MEITTSILMDSYGVNSHTMADIAPPTYCIGTTGGWLVSCHRHALSFHWHVKILFPYLPA